MYTPAPSPLLPILLFLISLLLSLSQAQTLPGTPCTGETAPILHSSGAVEIFFSGSDGRVYSAIRNNNAAAFSAPEVVGTVRVAPCSAVSAIMDKEERVDLFVTGDDGPVRTTTRTKTIPFTPWTQLAGGTAKANTLITPVETSNRVFVFWVGTDGITYETSLRSGNSTANAITTGKLPPGSHVTVLPRFENPSTIDLFLVGTNQHIYHNNFEAADETGTWTDLGYPSKLAAAIGAPVAAVVLGNGDCHLFLSALDGQVWTSVRSQAPAKPFSAWTLTGNLVVAPSAPVFAVRSGGNANAIELFVTGLDSRVYMSTWNGGFSPWEVVAGVSTVVGAPVTGVAVSETRFDLFVTGEDKNVSTIEWNVGQSRDCAWWGVGEQKVSCTKKIGEEGTGTVNTSASIAQASKKGQYIGMGVAIGLLVGILIVGGLGFWFFVRLKRKARECEEKNKMDEASRYAPAEMGCGQPEPTELPDTDSNPSLK